ncbi:MAG: YezD family protein [Pelosinus sp.]|nr:YezD family protein [Pelosinus sp.]
MGKDNKKTTNIRELEITSEVMELIEKSIRGIYHGSVTLVVQDSHIVQIEKNEKIKLC